MKIKSGFVSNSSSCSFVLFGIGFQTWEEASQALGITEITLNRIPGCQCEVNRDNIKFCPNCGHPAWKDQKGDYGEKIQTAVEHRCHELNLTAMDYDGVYIGARVQGTGKQALDQLGKVNEQILKMFGIEAEFVNGEYFD
jgi:hypothetical protein